MANPKGGWSDLYESSIPLQYRKENSKLKHHPHYIVIVVDSVEKCGYIILAYHCEF